ncbi:unnamed protein product [Oppiella nova]|uniref:Uncharacterized protein n=1 Tax=Oppiella nova TaxID=334625 RepID=A0A7R9LJA1_9ACAR|nr:unnamed protein product [Oppiella nova]CAG2163785.1 unnamed protein product [Oppiella nova]
MSQLYAKDSLDRFGDDLCELLLSYLPLEDRFRNECVSKQFQRCVFVTLRDLIIDEKLMKKMTKKYFPINIMAIIMEKCPNIQHIHCTRICSPPHDCSQHMDDQIHHNYHHHRRVHRLVNRMDGNRCPFEDKFDVNLMTEFFQTYGSMITKINFLDTDFKHYLYFCHNLSHLKTQYLSDVLQSGKLLLVRNLKRYEFHMNRDFNNQMFDTFVANNKSLKSIVVQNIAIRSQETVIEFMNKFTELTELQELSLYFGNKTVRYSLSDCFTEIGLKCKKLKKLCVQMKSNSTELNVEIFNSIQYFSGLKRLDLSLNLSIGLIVSNSLQSFDSFKCWPQLTHLCLDLWQMSDKFYDRIDKMQPKLQHLDTTDPSSQLSGKDFKHISRLPNLRTLIIRNSNKNKCFDPIFLNVLALKCAKIMSIEIWLKAGQTHGLNERMIESIKKTYQMRLNKRSLMSNTSNHFIDSPEEVAHN